MAELEAGGVESGASSKLSWHPFSLKLLQEGALELLPHDFRSRSPMHSSRLPRP